MKADQFISWVLNFKILCLHIFCVEVGKNEMLHMSYANTPLHYKYIVYALFIAQFAKHMKCKMNYY